jgi:hypothetical protein
MHSTMNLYHAGQDIRSSLFYLLAAPLRGRIVACNGRPSECMTQAQYCKESLKRCTRSQAAHRVLLSMFHVHRCQPTYLYRTALGGTRANGSRSTRSAPGFISSADLSIHAHISLHYHQLTCSWFVGQREGDPLEQREQQLDKKSILTCLPDI